MGRSTCSFRRQLQLGAAFLALTIPHAAFAQDAETPVVDSQDSGPAADAAQQDADNSEIVVTGSRIHGVAPIGSPIFQMDRDALRKSPGTTVTDMLKELPQVSTSLGLAVTATALPGGGPSNASRNTGFNIRGLGTNATLTLIDGRRLPRSGITGGFLDPNSLPSIAVERVEVVPDGASAIYGSDAIAGVINIITRKKMDGLDVKGRIGFADGYKTYYAGGIAGKTWNTGSLIASVEYTSNTRLKGAERGFYRSDLTDVGGDDYRVTTCAPGNLIIDGISYAIPGSGTVTPDSFTAGARQRCDASQYYDLVPVIKRYAASGHLEQKLFDGLKLVADAFYLHRTVDIEMWKAGSVTTYFTSRLPDTNAYFVRPAGAGAGAVTIESRLDEARFAPGVRQNGTQKVLQVSGGLEAELPFGWRGEATATHSINKDRYGGYTIDGTALAAALASSDPETAFNPFGPTNPAVIDKIMQGQFFPFTTIKTWQYQVHLDGPLFDLPAGKVRAAVGYEFLRDKLQGGALRGSVSNPVYQAPSYNLQGVNSVFAELAVPVTAESSPIGKIDLSLAGRYDSYSDVGSTTNPKVGINWLTPIDGLKLHGSYGTSFRAQVGGTTPLSVIGAAVYVLTTRDPEAPAPATDSIGLNIRGGNPALKPETAETWSVGADWTPDSVPGLRASLTYWSVDWSGKIGSYSPNATVLPLVQTDIYGRFTTRYNSPGAPTFTQADLDALTLDGLLPISGVLPPLSDIKFVYDSRLANLGATQARGIDASIAYTIPTGAAGSFDVGLAGSWNTKLRQQQTPTAPFIDVLGTIGYPVKLHGRGWIGWENGPLDAQLALNYVGGYDNNTVTPVERVSSWETFDLHLGYAPETGALRGFRVALDVTNLFDRDPPYVNIDGGFDPTEANPFGRTTLITLAKSF